MYLTLYYTSIVNKYKLPRLPTDFLGFQKNSIDRNFNIGRFRPRWLFTQKNEFCCCSFDDDSLYGRGSRSSNSRLFCYGYALDLGIIIRVSHLIDMVHLYLYLYLMSYRSIFEVIEIVFSTFNALQLCVGCRQSSDRYPLHTNTKR